MQYNRIACDTPLELVNGSRDINARGNNIEFNTAPLAASDVTKIDLADNFWGDVRRRRSVRSIALKVSAEHASFAVDPMSKSAYEFVRSQVETSFVDTTLRRDRKFHWYKGKKHLIGTAEL